MLPSQLIDIKERIAISSEWTSEQRDFLLDAINIAAATGLPQRRVELHYNPPNYLDRIGQLWAGLSLDDGGEGVCAAPVGTLTLPLFAADRQRLKSFIMPMAQRIATAFNKPVRIAKFSKREDVEIIQPGQI